MQIGGNIAVGIRVGTTLGSAVTQLKSKVMVVGDVEGTRAPDLPDLMLHVPISEFSSSGVYVMLSQTAV